MERTVISYLEKENDCNFVLEPLGQLDFHRALNIVPSILKIHNLDFRS